MGGGGTALKIVIVGGAAFVLWDLLFNCSNIITPLKPYNPFCKGPPIITADPRLTERASRGGRVSERTGTERAGSRPLRVSGRGSGGAGAGGSGRGSVDPGRFGGSGDEWRRQFPRGITPASPSRGITPARKQPSKGAPKQPASGGCDGKPPLEWFACHVARGASILGNKLSQGPIGVPIGAPVGAPPILVIP